jgi:hypothetical protein
MREDVWPIPPGTYDFGPLTEPERWVLFAAIALLRSDGYSEDESIRAITSGQNWRRNVDAILGGWRPRSFRHDRNEMDPVDMDANGAEITVDHFLTRRAMFATFYEYEGVSFTKRIIIAFADGSNAEYLLDEPDGRQFAIRRR